MQNPFLEIEKKLTKQEVMLQQVITLLNNKPATSAPAEASENYLDITEIMQKFNIKSATTVWRWQKEGKLQYAKVGRKRLFAESQFNALMNKKTR